MAYEWFISYRRKTGGENQARQVAEILSKYVGKDKVFYDRVSMREGNWRDQINDALNSAEHFVLLVNEASAAEDQSNNIGGYRYEIEYALNSEKLKNNRITIIAYDNESYKAVTKEFSDLSSAQKVTYYGEYAKNFEERLCDHFEFEYQKPSSAPTVIHNISYPENLIPRRDMLDKLDHEFNSHQCVVISGIGGSGKTSLAYLYAKEQNFNNVAWVIVNGKIEDVFLDKIAGLLFTENDDYERFTKINDKQIKLDRIKSELSKIEGNNLLVFDINTNNEAIKQEIENEIHNYLPTSNNWKTIVLTRVLAKNKNWFATIPMETMSEEIAIEIFNKNYEGYVEFSDEQLVEIVKKLYYHPLLIEHTAKVYYNEFGITAEEILNQINENIVSNELTKKDLSGLAKDGKEQQDIYTYLTNLCNIKKLSEAEVKFLAVYVTWPEEPIDYEVIATLLPNQKDALASLINRGIIRYNKQFSIHSLMADVIREQINIKEFDYTEYLDNIDKILDDDIKSVALHRYSKCIASSFINYGICGRIVLFYAFLNNLRNNNDVILYQLPMPELYHLANEFEENAEPDDLANLYNAIAGVEVFKNNLHDAKMHLEKALEVIASAEENAEILDIKGALLQNLAMLEANLDDTDSAKKHYEESLEIKRKLPETPEYLNSLATTLGNLAGLEEKLGETDSAKKHWQETIEIEKKLPETPQLLNLLSSAINNLAMLEVNLGEPDSAKKHYKEAVEVNRKLLELTETPMYFDSLASSLTNLADLEDDLGDTDSAKKHFEEAVEKRRQLPETPMYLDDFANSLAGLAKVEAKLGDINSSKKHFEEGLEVSRRSRNEKYIKIFEKVLSSL